MQTYKVLTNIRGLRRAEPARERDPIENGHIIALPADVAQPLLMVSAIEPSEEEATCPLAADDAPVVGARISADDLDGLVAGVRALGGAARVVRDMGVAELKAAIADRPDLQDLLPAPVVLTPLAPAVSGDAPPVEGNPEPVQDKSASSKPARKPARKPADSGAA